MSILLFIINNLRQMRTDIRERQRPGKCNTVRSFCKHLIGLCLSATLDDVDIIAIASNSENFG
jgi:hypothetical protein